MEINKEGKYLKFMPRKIFIAVFVIMTTSCVSTRPGGPLQPKSLTTDESSQIDLQLNKLYQSFCYDSGEEPDWELMRSVFIEGAQFVGEAPAGGSPSPQSVDEFISSWQKSIRRSDSVTVKTTEHLISTKVTKVGKLIRVEVLFQAKKKNDPSPRKPGLDTVVFANDKGIWKVLSFVVHYESKL